MTHSEDVVSVMTKAWQICGHIDVVVNNAGFAGYGLYNASKFAGEGLSEALNAKLQPLGIRVTIVDPDYFRTEFLSGNSLQRANRVIEAYAAISGRTREMADERDGRQLGDPALAAKAIIAITQVEHPPLRLILGANAVERVRAKLTQVSEDLEAWKSTRPAEDQFGLLRDLQQAGKILYVGLSEVSVVEIKAARRIVPIVTVHNLYNLADRKHEVVVDYCTREGIGFIPWFPLATGNLATSGGPLARAAEQFGAQPAQVAIAWLLRKSPVMLPIPGTSKVKHLEENTAAALLELDDSIMAELEHTTNVNTAYPAATAD